ncbi:asparagine synthase (glutamine-hydrolyzing) [Candidatus Woesearchaeota archaeon]|nr:asparagine synthase (glutamine-hydrolyzing) [Candidatus Woesearchaeota archaeon]
MCGITGIWGLNDKQLVKKMNDALEHRGPDDEGYFFDENISLGHRRLSIIDLNTGKQPIFNEDKSVVVICNGEIYNYKLLKKDLKNKGHEFYTKSDTEVIVHLYEEFGLHFVKYLEGMFAFALYDGNGEKLILGRDHAGIKPLFYSKKGNILLFGSEMKSLLVTPFIKPKINYLALKEKFIFENYNLKDTSIFEDVFHVLPGTLMVLRKSGNVGVYNYNKRKYSPKISDERISIKLITDLLNRSVESRLMSDVSLGTMLSGGIDSCTVAAFHRKLVGDKQIHTFSVTDSYGSEDSKNAKIMADYINSIHHEFIFGFEDIVNTLPSFVYHLEDIEYGIIYNYFLSKGIKKFATVVLSGNGSDEIFGGYHRYKHINQMKRSFIADAKKIGLDESKPHVDVLQSINTLSDALSFEQNKGALANFQLAQVDRLSMAFAVEVRVPFLHKGLVSICNNLSDDLKIRDGVEKYILRKSITNLKVPQVIRNRRKVAGGLENTTPKAMPRFEEYCKKLVNSKKSKHDEYFKKPGKNVCFNLLKYIFIENEGRIPKNFAINELY